MGFPHRRSPNGICPLLRRCSRNTHQNYRHPIHFYTFEAANFHHDGPGNEDSCASNGQLIRANEKATRICDFIKPPRTLTSLIDHLSAPPGTGEATFSFTADMKLSVVIPQ